MNNIFKFLDRPFVTLNILSTCNGMPATKCCNSGPSLIKRKQANIFLFVFLFWPHTNLWWNSRASSFITTFHLKMIQTCFVLYNRNSTIRYSWIYLVTYPRLWFIHRKTRAFRIFILIHDLLLAIYKFEGLKLYTPYCIS